MRTYSVLMLSAALAFTASTAAADSSRRELQLRQQQDALNLNLQQSMRARRYDLSPSDARRLDQLNLEQRLQQQQLDHVQIQRDELLRRQADTLPQGIGEARMRAQQDNYDQQRMLQMQQFELDRQRLLQSMPREPLQSPAGATLRVP